jgi:predicted small lipoprotein YifL
MFRWLVPTTAALVLAGCGLKGDLYLPPPPAPAPEAPATPGEADSADTTDRGERRQVPPAPAGDAAR